MEFAAASRRENIPLALESHPARSRGAQSTSLGLRIQIPHAAALKFRNNILSLDPRDFLVRRVYDGLMNDSKGRGSSRGFASVPGKSCVRSELARASKKTGSEKVRQ